MTSAPGAERRTRRLVLAIAGLLISGFFLYLVFRKVEVAALWREIRDVEVVFLAASVLTKLAAFICITVRSKILLAPSGHYRWWGVFKSHLVAFLGNGTLPFRIGELLRIDYLARIGQVSRGGCLAVVAFERVLDSFLLLVVVAAVSPLILSVLVGAAGLLTFAGGVLIALVGGWSVSRWPDVYLVAGKRLTGFLGSRVATVVDPRLESFVGGFSALRSVWRLSAVMLCSAGFWAASAGSVALWMRAFGLDLPWYAPFVVLVFIALGIAVPSSPGAVGTYDYFAMQGLAVFGVGPARAASFAIVGHAVALLPFTVISLIVLMPELKRVFSRRVLES